MKILYHHRIRSKDGQYVHLSEIIKALKELGHEVVVVGPRIQGNSADDLGTGWVARFKRLAPKPLYELAEFAYSFVDLPRIVYAIRNNRPDVIYERYNLFFLSGIWAKRLFSIPLLLEVNAPLAQERAEFGGIGLKRLSSWAEGHVWRRADLVLPVTAVLGRIIEGRGVPPDRIEVIRNGVDPAVFAPPNRYRRGDENEQVAADITIGFVGYLRHWHRLDTVISLLANPGNQNVKFIVLGDGPARRSLEAHAGALGVSDRVEFAGEIAREDLPARLGLFDIALQPSVVDYASPLKLQEYMAMGCAIVAPDKDNIREVLTDGENALLFDGNAEGAFALAVERLCTDRHLRERLGRNAALTVSARNLTWSANAKRIVELGHELLPGQR